MRKSSTASNKSANKLSINQSDSINESKQGIFEQKQKEIQLKKQKSIIDAIQSQLEMGQRSKQERYEFLKDVMGEDNLGIIFFENNTQTNPDRNKLYVDYDQINKALNIIKSTKKDPKRRDTVQKESNCATLQLQDLKTRMAVINNVFPQEELQFMFPPRKEINSKELFELLKPNQIQKDPLTEALKLFMDQNGELSKVKLNQMMKYLGYGQLDAKEMIILKDILDMDSDGKIGLEDLKEVFSNSNQIYFEQQQQKEQDSENNQTQKHLI